MIIANGARFGGHSLFVKDRRLWYLNDFLGIPPEQQVVSADELTPGAHVLGVELKTQPGHFALCGEGLSVGRDSSDPVSKEYGAPFAFTGGRIRVVEINVGDDGYVLERDFHAAMARD